MKFWKILKIVGLVLLVVALILAWMVAIINGQRSAAARQVVKDVNAITSGLEYFYQDQNRYPSVGEFNDQNIMRQYLSNYPPQIFATGICSASLEYSNTFRNDYELRFCLPNSVKGWPAGWNTISAPKK